MIELTDAAERFYNMNPREYHNYDHHANDVVRQIFTLCEKPSNALVLAGVWHDAIYFPGADQVQKALNEHASAAALFSTHKTLRSKVKQADVDQAMVLIIGTCIDEHLSALPKSGDQAILMDADLGGLAAPWLQFIDSQEKIIRENNAEVNETSLRACSTFLTRLLNCRPHLYHTDLARELYEVRAKANIIAFEVLHNELPSS
jgi:predicted metal-dependent HD superfamily phosphohydrolase